MKKKIILLLCFCLMVWAGSADGVMSYLDNGTIKVGIDTNRGATINYLSASGSTRNVINYADLGREVQQSYYSGPVPFMGGYYNGSDWGWNPVAAGDMNDNRSTVVTYTNNGTTIYTKIIPKQWALDDVDSECTMETWITLSGSVVHVQCQLVVDRVDTNWYGAFHQELPAVYTTADLYRQFAYTGSSPFTSGGLTEIINSGPPWVYINATENWIANVDGSNWGLGVYNPKAQYTVMGFYGTHDTSPPGNPTSSSTSYIAPIRSEILDHDITYKYDFYLILGALTDIRNYVYSHQPNKLPDYVFAEDRQGWYYKSGLYDAGFPINGYVRVLTVSSDPYMFGPETLWQAGAVPKVYVRARYNTTNTSVKFYWSKFSSPGFTDANSKSFTIISDGQFHTYEVDLSSDSDYTGAIKQLRFDPVSSGGSGQYVDIASITSYPPAGAPVIAEVWPDPDTNSFAGVEYTKQLQLTEGTAPITWSVVQGPAGIAVSSSGYVDNWTPGGCDVGESITIEIRAQNSVGSDTETWQVEPQAYYWTDDIVNLSDLMVMADEWLLTSGVRATDLDCSGNIDLGDFAGLAGVWLEVPAPGQASNPSPANGVGNVGIDDNLSWTAGAGATSHDVYFGTVSPGTSQGNQAGTTFEPGTMGYETTYFWRIDEVNAGGTTTGTVWSFTTAPLNPDLIISNISPANYAVSYDDLGLGELVYIDRSYTFTNVASLGGSTYIKTANDDKYSTGSSFLTFDINRTSTVYVAHDDGLSPKPSWLSTFTDTGENIAFGPANLPFSVYSRTFSAGTVTLGGNEGTVSSSMYIVVVVEQ